MKTYSKSPNDCTPQELNDFESLVLEGGEVIAYGLLDRIKIAKKLIFVHSDACIGVGAIKLPNEHYKNNIFKKAGVAGLAGNYSLELGWLFASHTARDKGVGNKLMQYTTNAIKNTTCFATTRDNNDVMHHLLTKHSFTKLGKKYKSGNGDYSLVLYVYSP